MMRVVVLHPCTSRLIHDSYAHPPPQAACNMASSSGSPFAAPPPVPAPLGPSNSTGSNTTSTSITTSPQRASGGSSRRLSRGQQQYSDPQTYPYAFHPRDDSLRSHAYRLVFLAVFSPLIVLNWVRIRVHRISAAGVDRQ